MKTSPVLILLSLCFVPFSSQQEGFFGIDSFFEDENYYFDEEYVEDQSHSDHQEERVNFTHEVCRGSVVSSYGWDYNNYFPLYSNDNKTSLHVKFRGYSDAYIVLSPEGQGTNYDNLYTIVLSNSKSTIFKTHPKDSHETVVSIHTPNILSDHFYRGFNVQFDLISGYLIISSSSDASEVPILVYKDPDPLDIKYYSFHSDYYGNKFHVAFECKPNGNGNDKSGTTIEKIDSTNSDYGVFATPDPKIRKKLLENYDPLAQPYPRITTVTIPYITVIHYDIDDQAQTFEVHAWVVMSWTDERLYWRNYSMYDSTGYLHFSKREVWTPEITTYNTAKPQMQDFAEEAQVLVQSNGTVMWVPPVRFITNCKMNLLDWPVGDTQRCQIKIGSWTFHERELDIQFGPQSSPASRVLVMEFEGHKFPNNTQWLITSAKAERHSIKYACCAEKYVDITYYFVLTRQYSIFSFTLILPVLFISFVSAFGFIFPINGNSRITLAAFNVLIITAYMIYFRTRLPTIDHVPRIVKLFTWNLFITTFNIIMTPVLLHLIQAKGNSRIPDWAKTLLNSKFVTYISFGQRLDPVRRNSLPKARNFIRKSDSDGISVEDGGSKFSSSAAGSGSSDSARKSKRNDWTSLVELINKIFFTVLGFMTLMMVFSVVI